MRGHSSLYGLSLGPSGREVHKERRLFRLAKLTPRLLEVTFEDHSPSTVRVSSMHAFFSRCTLGIRALISLLFLLYLTVLGVVWAQDTAKQETDLTKNLLRCSTRS